MRQGRSVQLNEQVEGRFGFTANKVEVLEQLKEEEKMIRKYRFVIGLNVDENSEELFERHSRNTPVEYIIEDEILSWLNDLDYVEHVTIPEIELL